MLVVLSVLTLVLVTWMVAGFIDPARAVRWDGRKTRGRVLLVGVVGLAILALLFYLV